MGGRGAGADGRKAKGGEFWGPELTASAQGTVGHCGCLEQKG